MYLARGESKEKSPPTEDNSHNKETTNLEVKLLNQLTFTSSNGFKLKDE
jgi:hypothetical protein